MDKNQQELFKIILEEVLAGISEKELGDLIDTFVGIYEAKFGAIASLVDEFTVEPEEQELLHTNEATEYLKKFKL